MPTPDALLKIAPVLSDQGDLRSLKLSPQEGFLISQIDGMTPAGVLCDLVALDETMLIIALQRLEKLGVIKWARRHTDPGTHREATEDTDEQRAIAEESAEDPALTENCDLSRDERLQILKAEREFPNKTHWEILGLSGDPSASDVKRAYFVASKSFHPDRFFGREMGSFTDRLEGIFFRLKQAYDTLSDEETRRAYRAEHAPPSKAAAAAVAEAEAKPAGKPSGPESAVEKEARLEVRRQQILEERKQKRKAKYIKPKGAAQANKNQRAEEMYQMGLGQLRSGDVFAAVASFKLAMTYDPDNGQYSSMFEEANSEAMLQRAVEVAEQAETAANTGAAAESARLFARAFEMTPNKTEYAVKAAEQFLQVNEVEEALQYAGQAVEVAPKRKGPRIALAQALELAGDRKAAIEHLRVAESLDPADAHVKKTLKRLAK